MTPGAFVRGILRQDLRGARDSAAHIRARRGTQSPAAPRRGGLLPGSFQRVAGVARVALGAGTRTVSAFQCVREVQRRTTPSGLCLRAALLRTHTAAATLRPRSAAPPGGRRGPLAVEPIRASGHNIPEFGNSRACSPPLNG